MSEQDKPLGLLERLRNWLYGRLGRVGVVLFAFIIWAGYVYINWDKAQEWPGVPTIIRFLTAESIPQADPNRFSVMVAHLENDPNSEHERLIVEALKETEGIQVLRLDRTIPLEKGAVPEEEERRGHEKARGCLKQSGASVLIWGKILRRGSETVPKIYWTASRGRGPKPTRYHSPLFEDQFRLPEVFWSDIAMTVRSYVAWYAIQFNAERGQYVADRLPGLIAQMRALLKSSRLKSVWDWRVRGKNLVILGDCLRWLGDQSGRNEPIEESLDVFGDALKELTRKRDEVLWAMAQYELGVALLGLGQRESSALRLTKAERAFRKALEVRTPERFPLDWATTQNDLARVYRLFGPYSCGQTNPVKVKVDNPAIIIGFFRSSKCSAGA